MHYKKPEKCTGHVTRPQNPENPGTALRNEGHQQVDDGDEHEHSIHDVPAGREIRFSAVEHASGYHLREHIFVAPRLHKSRKNYFNQHLEGKHNSKNVICCGQENPLRRVWRDVGSLHGQGYAVEANEEQHHVIKPPSLHNPTAQLSDFSVKIFHNIV